MKNLKLFIYAALPALLLSCNKKMEFQLVEKNGINEITACFVDNETKTVLDDDKSTVLWSPGDEINVYYGSSGIKFTSINTLPSKSSIFTTPKSIMFVTGEESDDYIWGVYPYSENNKFLEDGISLFIPSTQTAVVGSFGQGCFPSIGRSHTTLMSFYNICGGVCFSLTQPGVQVVTFRGNGNENIAGNVKVIFNDSGVPEVAEIINGSTNIQINAPSESGFEVGKLYYFSVLPQTLYNGFTMTFRTNSAQAIKKNSSLVSVKRSIFGKMESVDAGLEYNTIEEIDLSASGTANCYIVNQTGDYKFNSMVQGNSTELLKDPVYAEVIWENIAGHSFSRLGVVINYNVYRTLDGFIHLSIPKIFKNGNVGIAVKNNVGEIIWSWHIWVCKKFDPEATAQKYSNDAGTMMDRNLGAISTIPGEDGVNG